MRGSDRRSGEPCSYLDVETRVRPDHSKRTVRSIVAGLRKTRFIARARTDWTITFAAAACNLVRLPKLLAAAG